MTKTYQIFDAPSFPAITEIGRRFSTKNQLTIWGDTEEIRTRLTLLSRDRKRGFDELRLKTEIVIQAFGFIKVFDEATNGLKKQDFTEYMRPVDLRCFYFPQDSYVVMQASKQVCRGVLRNLCGKTDEIVLKEILLDFSKLPANFRRLTGAWFRNVSPNIRSEGFTGEDIEGEERVRMLMGRAASTELRTTLSTITIPYELHSANHQVQITKESAVCLQHNYESTSTELDLVIGIKRDLIDLTRFT